MIIKSHVRGGYRAAADYMKDQGLNEKTRLVELSDPSAKNLDEAFHNMWVVANTTRCTKPLHHISINPMKDERLSDKQVLAIVERCEAKYGYKMFHHQRVIVEHVKEGRQHFHVIWNRVSLYTASPVWPGEHWKKSKQVCREMEKELGLKRPTPRRAKLASGGSVKRGVSPKSQSRRPSASVSWKRFSHTQSPPTPRIRGKTYQASPSKKAVAVPQAVRRSRSAPHRPVPFIPAWASKRRKKDINFSDLGRIFSRTPEQELAELIAWAFENGRFDILAYCGIVFPPDDFQP